MLPMARTHARAALLAASLLLPAARRTDAQDAPAPASCAAPLQPVAGMFSQDTLVLALDPGYRIAPQPTPAQELALAAVAEALILPSPLPLPAVLTRVARAEGGLVGAQGLMAEAFIEVAKDGKVKSVGLSQTSLVPAIDRALVAAVRAAADSGAFAGYQKAARGPGGFVFVELRSVPLPTFQQKVEDYMRHSGDPTITPDPRPPKKGEITTLPVKVLRVPLVHLTSESAPGKGKPHPQFPPNELGAAQDGFVNLEFVVGADGLLVPGTLRFANAMTAGYARAVAKSLEGYRFVPAMADGCPVAQRQTWTFTFDVY